jgi:uncharacterized protein YcgL (UPF0745 family)
LNLIIDGNYILNKNVFSLHKDKLLYGALQESLENAISLYSSWFSFENIYFVSDSYSNWRKQVYPDYKGNRTKSEDIDWEFVSTVYSEFKRDLPKRIKLFEQDRVEGDDWIYFLTKKTNEKNISSLIISNDGDIKQLLYTGENFINIMVNENNLYDNIYLPENYRTWLSIFNRNSVLPDLFDDDSGYDIEVYNFIKRLISQRQVKEVDNNRVLIEKIVGGDYGDNIKSVYIKNGRGIGKKTAEKIYDKYIEYFGEPVYNNELYERLIDIVMTEKKVPNEEYNNVSKRIDENNFLVNLDKIPKDIIKIMEEKYEQYE